MNPELLDAYLTMLWARLVQSATVHNTLALEAGTGTLPVPPAPWVMVSSFTTTGVVTATPENPELFLDQINLVVGGLVDIYDRNIPKLMEASAAKGGKFGTNMKLAQRIHEVTHGAVVNIKA